MQTLLQCSFFSNKSFLQCVYFYDKIMCTTLKEALKPICDKAINESSQALQTVCETFLNDHSFNCQTSNFQHLSQKINVTSPDLAKSLTTLGDTSDRLYSGVYDFFKLPRPPLEHSTSCKKFLYTPEKGEDGYTCTEKQTYSYYPNEYYVSRKSAEDFITRAKATLARKANTTTDLETHYSSFPKYALISTAILVGALAIRAGIQMYNQSTETERKKIKSKSNIKPKQELS